MSSMVVTSTVISVLSLLSIFPFVVGYTFDVIEQPTQCGPLSLQIMRGNGSPPYTALIVPFGPRQGTTEQRRILTHQFSDTTTSFSLPYPASSEFILILSDSNGVGTGGTSVPTTVGPSSNSSCLPTNPVSSPEFDFQISTLIQCQPETLEWNGAQGKFTILLIIPGSQSSEIDTSSALPLSGNVRGLQWTPSIPAGTAVLLVAMDALGPSAGRIVTTVVAESSNSTCLNNNTLSPNSTVAVPSTISGSKDDTNRHGGHGGGRGGGGGGGGSKSNAGVIAGAVVGGLAAAVIACLALFYIRRRRRQQHAVVDLLSDSHPDPTHPSEFYKPEPFIVGPSRDAQLHHDMETTGEASMSMSDAPGPGSVVPTADQNNIGAGAALSSDAASGVRKSQGGMQGRQPLRPVNFVLHEDGGELAEESGSGPSDEAEIIELPPTYNSVQR